MGKQYHWATLGCGVIAHQLAEAMEKQGKKLYSVANRTHDKAVVFARKYGVEKVYGNMDEVFTDENVDIIYISTPHNTHKELMLKALRNGKHVLCEKAITLNSEELSEVLKVAEENHVILAEAMTIFHMPIYKNMEKIIKSGVLGPLRMVQMNFGSYKEYNMKSRFYNRNLAGGALLDIGVYALSFIRWFMSEKPDQILSQVRYAESGVDEQVGILLMNPKQEMATVTLSLHAKQPKRGTVAFDKGYIEIYEYPRAEKAVITYTEDSHQEIFEIGKTDDALLYEIQDMEETINSCEIGICDENAPMYMKYTKDVMEIMTDIRKQWGMTYPEEEF